MMMLRLKVLLPLLSLISAVYIPPPFPSATSTPTARPALQPQPAGPSPTLAPRCDNGDCSGATATMLQADTVTSTLLSITSVPCYITTFVTNEKTLVSTVYSTETITETMTKEGKVYIVQYAPVPIIKSTMVQTIIPVTVDMPSYWIESSGSAGYSTIKEERSTVGGGGGCASCGKPATGQGSAQPQGQQQGGPAWTHISSGTNTVAAGAVQAGDGWAAAASGPASGNGATWGNGQSAGGSGSTPSWYSAASPGKVADGRMALLCAGLAVGIVTIGEMLRLL